ncbi:MAG: phage holin family protein [Candidatus Komeilibacteria bacterium]
MWNVIITALAVLFSNWILPGIEVTGIGTAFLVAIVIALLNIFVKPLLVFFTLPATLVNLGLFFFVINVFLLYLASLISPGFEILGFWSAVFAALIITGFRSLFGTKKSSVSVNIKSNRHI